MSDTLTGAVVEPGCTSSPGAAERAVTSPEIGLCTVISVSTSCVRSTRAISLSLKPNSASVLRAARFVTSAACCSAVFCCSSRCEMPSAS